MKTPIEMLNAIIEMQEANYGNATNTHLNLSTLIREAKEVVKNCSIPDVSKRFEIDFDGNVLAGIEIANNEPKVFGAMNGWGNGISPDKCKITEKTN